MSTMFFGLVAVVTALFFSANSIKSARYDPTGARHREIIPFLLAGLLWINYSILASTWFIMILGIITVIIAVSWEIILQREKTVPVAIIIGGIGSVIVLVNMITSTIPVVIIGWLGLGMVILGVVSLVHGYLTKREGLYPISGNAAFGVALLGFTGTMHSLGEIGQLIPVFVSVTVLLLGIVMLFPIVFPALNNAAAAVSIATANGGADQEYIRSWAEGIKQEADEVKAQREATKQEKKNRREQQ